jgi:hypothetical protein
MSTGLDTVKQFRNIHKIPIMQNKGNINEMIYKDYLYSNGDLFKIDSILKQLKLVTVKMLRTKDSLNEAKNLMPI